MSNPEGKDPYAQALELYREGFRMKSADKLRDAMPKLDEAEARIHIMRSMILLNLEDVDFNEAITPLLMGVLHHIRLGSKVERNSALRVLHDVLVKNNVVAVLQVEDPSMATIENIIQEALDQGELTPFLHARLQGAIGQHLRSLSAIKL